MVRYTKHFIIQVLKGNHRVIEAGKLTTIGLFAVLSLFVSIYFLYFSPYVGFRFVYVFIPHLYLIPIILLALWYPKSGVRLVIVILCALFAFWALSSIIGYPFPPLFVILYTGIDLAIFVVFLLYVKDRRLVEAVIFDLIERNTEIRDNPSPDKFDGDFDAIITALSATDESSREEAVSALSGLNDDRIIFPLIKVLRDESPYVRRSAANALGNTGSLIAVKPLIEALADEDRLVREAAAEGLGHLGKIATPELIKRVSDKDWRIRMGIVIAFRITQNNPNIDLIIQMLSDNSLYVRREAVKSLGRIGDQRIFPYLVEAVNDQDAGVRLRAVRAMAKVGKGGDLTPILKRCTHDPDGAVRLRAVEELQRFQAEKLRNE